MAVNHVHIQYIVLVALADVDYVTYHRTLGHVHSYSVPEPET